MHWSYGRGTYGPIVDTVEGTWTEFTDLLDEVRHKPQDPADKTEWWWCSPMVRRPGVTSRRLEDVDSLGAWFPLDLDKVPLSLNDIRVRVGPWSRWLCHTTASSTPDAPRWHVMLGLSRAITVSEYYRLFRWFATTWPLDPQCGNPNRIWFLPAEWQGADNLWHAQDGLPLNVDSVLSMVPEVEPPSAAYTNGATLKPAPNGTPIIHPAAIDQARGRAVGGRLFSMMCAAAKKHRLNGWELDAHDLADAAEAASGEFAPGKRRNGVLREAERAIKWAQQFSPMTPLDKMRDRLLWESMRRSR